MIALTVLFGAGLLVCLAGFAAWFPAAATVIWILVLETSPDMWLAALTGGHETIIGALKAAGVMLAVLLGVRFGWRADRYNPAFAFLAMFAAGLAHGLYPGLSVLSSLRSLLGSAAPFLFGFARLPQRWCRAVIRTVILGPVLSVGFGAALNLLGLHAMVALEQGALRLGGPGEPPFLAGFTLIGIYAGLLEFLARRRRVDTLLLAVNFMILLLTGARAPLFLAMALLAAFFLLPATGMRAGHKIMLLAGAGVAVSLAALFATHLGFIRVVNLAQLGEAGDLSNRELVWPFFERAFAASPYIGWGVGAGKAVVPLTASLSTFIGTNAAHNEYLRIGVEGGVIGLALLIVLLWLWVWRGSQNMPRAQRRLLRLVFLAFAVHSATDNTLIATTSSVFFIWASAVFARASRPQSDNEISPP